jgi:PAS domain S-box-containing protein
MNNGSAHPYPPLANALEASRAAILAEWEKRVRSVTNPDGPVLAREAAPILGYLERALRAFPASSRIPAYEFRSLPAGRSMAAIVRELGALRATISEFLPEEHASGKEAQLFLHGCLDQVLEAAATQTEAGQGAVGEPPSSHEAEAREFRRERERLGRVAAATGLGIWYCDLPFDELSWNKEVKEHFFLPPDARVTIDTFYERIHPEDRELTRRAIAESNRTGERYDIEYRTTSEADPTQFRWIRAVGWTAYDQDRKPKSFDGFTLDITDQKRVEDELADSQAAILENEQLLKLITDRLPAFVAYVDHDLRYRFMNETYRASFGAGATPGKLMKEVLRPEVFDKALPYARQALGGKKVRYENTISTLDGRELVLDTEYLPDIHPRTGEVRGYVVVAHDITHRKIAAQALEESERRLSLALKASRIGIFDLNLQKDELVVSEQFASDWGFDPGTRFTRLAIIESFVHPEDRELVKSKVQATLERGEVYDYEPRIRRGGNGETRWVHTKAEVSYDAAGQPERLLGTTVDVTDQRRAKDELAASAARFQSLTESIPQIVWAARPDGFVFWYSQQWYNYTGLSEGEHWESMMHPEDIPPTYERYRHALETGTTYEAEYRFRGKDGQYRWFLGRAVPLRDSEGRIMQWIGTNTDINDRVETAQVLRERSELFRLITDTIPHGVWRTNPDGAGDYFSQRFSEIVGYPVEELLGWGWAEVIHPEDRPRVLKAWQEGRDAQAPVAAEFRVKGAEGRDRWFISLGNPFFDASGNLVKYYGTWTDIDEQKTRAGQLQKLAETSLLLNSTRPLSDKLAIITEQSREILGAHQAALRLEPLIPGGEPVSNTSYSAKYALARGSLLDPAETGLYDLLCRLNRPVRFTQAELEATPGYRRALGNHPAPRHGFLAAPLVNGRGEPIGVLQISDKYEGEFAEADEGIFAQVAQIASAAIENAQLLEREQAAVVARDEFLSIASHELKTPLTSLKLQSQIFQRMVEKGDARAYQPERLGAVMDQTNRQVNRLTRLVDDMLDISRIRTGKLSVQPRPILMGELVHDALERMLPHFRKEGVPEPVLDVRADPLVNADPVRMEQVVNNLLTNALRYGKGQPVHVTLEKSGGGARLTVRDQGMGIERQNLEKIFDRFERAVSANEVSGLGLGLYISRQIVKAHGGRIWAESEPGQGSAFYVELPEHHA